MEALKIVLVSAVNLSKITIKSLWQIQKGKKKAKRASKIFEQKLITMGVDKSAAKEFAKKYREISKSISLSKLLNL